MLNTTEERSSRSARSSWLWILLVGALLLVLGGLWVSVLRRSRVPAKTEVESQAGLSLKVERESNLMRISWNRESPLIVSAKGGILSIVDGDIRKDLNLEVADLHSGAVVYSQVTGDVTLRLHVMGAQGEASESVRVVGLDPFTGPPARSASVDARSRRWTGRVTTRKRAITTETPPDRIRMPLLGTTAPMPLRRAPMPKNEQRPPGVEADGTNIHDPSPASAEQAKTARTSVSPDPLGVPVVGRKEATSKITESNSRPEAAAVSLPPAVSSPSDEKVKASLVPEQVSPSRQEQLPTIAQAQDLEIRIDYVAPRPLRRVKPSLPSSLRHLAVAGVRIDVKVYIDAAGMVVRVEPLTKGNALIDYLSSLAVDAARQWLFSPARRDNQSVPSETELQFQFSGGPE